MRYVALYVHHADSGSSSTADTCQESDKTPIKTGLLNASGVPIYRIPDTQQLGFKIPEKA